MAKGSSFEREICRVLSEWWSGGTRDDLYWRSAASGARATVRFKKGKATANSHGDIAALDEVGAPLLKVVALELKRGYKDTHFADVFDIPAHAKQKEWERFVEQAHEAKCGSGSMSWMLITRRDHRRALAVFPQVLQKELCKAGAFPDGPPVPSAVIRVQVRASKDSPAPPLPTSKKQAGLHSFVLVVMRLDDFLNNVTPEQMAGVVLF